MIKLYISPIMGMMLGIEFLDEETCEEENISFGVSLDFLIARIVLVKENYER